MIPSQLSIKESEFKIFRCIIGPEDVVQRAIHQNYRIMSIFQEKIVLVQRDDGTLYAVDMRKEKKNIPYEFPGSKKIFYDRALGPNSFEAKMMEEFQDQSGKVKRVSVKTFLGSLHQGAMVCYENNGTQLEMPRREKFEAESEKNELKKLLCKFPNESWEDCKFYISKLLEKGASKRFILEVVRQTSLALLQTVSENYSSDFLMDHLTTEALIKIRSYLRPEIVHLAQMSTPVCLSPSKEYIGELVPNLFLMHVKEYEYYTMGVSYSGDNQIISLTCILKESEHNGTGATCFFSPPYAALLYRTSDDTSPSPYRFSVYCGVSTPESEKISDCAVQTLNMEVCPKRIFLLSRSNLVLLSTEQRFDLPGKRGPLTEILSTPISAFFEKKELSGRVLSVADGTPVQEMEIVKEGEPREEEVEFLYRVPPQGKEKESPWGIVRATTTQFSRVMTMRANVADAWLEGKEHGFATLTIDPSSKKLNLCYFFAGENGYQAKFKLPIPHAYRSVKFLNADLLMLGVDHEVSDRQTFIHIHPDKLEVDIIENKPSEETSLFTLGNAENIYRTVKRVVPSEDFPNLFMGNVVVEQINARVLFDELRDLSQGEKVTAEV